MPLRLQNVYINERKGFLFMAKEIFQLRYFGEEHSNNFPIATTAQMLLEGSFLPENSSIIKLGIQSIPGLKFYINGNISPIMLGSSGLYEIDLTHTTGVITALKFDNQILNNFSDYNNNYLFIDMIME